MGAFNEWVRGSFLEAPNNRQFEVIALNLMLGASVATRTAWLRNQGAVLPHGAGEFTPLELSDIKQLI